MERLEPLIAELEAARLAAIARFATEANMSVRDFERHFRVVLQDLSSGEAAVSFRVEPRE